MTQGFVFHSVEFVYRTEFQDWDVSYGVDSSSGETQEEVVILPEIHGVWVQADSLEEAFKTCYPVLRALASTGGREWVAKPHNAQGRLASESTLFYVDTRFMGVGPHVSCELFPDLMGLLAEVAGKYFEERGLFNP